jgi:hypothetical protein
LVIVDDFYGDPQRVREAALGCDYPEAPGPLTYPVRNSHQKYLPPGLDEAVSHVVSEPVVDDGSEGSTHGKFRITLENDKSRYMVHVDPNVTHWVSVVYLNLPEQCKGGTTFYRHRELNSDRNPVSQAELNGCGVPDVASLLRRDGSDPEKWEHLMTVPMRFNRLALYRPWVWHSSGAAFGDSLETGRLIQLIFFQSKSRI